MPPLPQSACLRRPVRSLRHCAGGYRADKPKVGDFRRCARAEAHTPLVSAAGPLGTHPTPLDSRRAPGMAPQRVRPVQKLARHGAAATRRKPRPVVGCSRACGRRRRQGALCVVRRPYRLHLQHQGDFSRHLGTVVEKPRDPHRELHRKRQHRVPLHCVPCDAQCLWRRFPAARQRTRQ